MKGGLHWTIVVYISILVYIMREKVPIKYTSFGYNVSSSTRVFQATLYDGMTTKLQTPMNIEKALGEGQSRLGES